MGEYDKIIKENIEAIFEPLLEKLLNISIKQATEIKDKIQTTIEREPDFLKRIIDHDNHEFILQLEFQTQDDHEMKYRMAEYKAILQRKYKIPVRQFTIFLGPKAPTMQTELSEEEQIIGFELLNIQDLSTASVLNSEIPEEIILAILTEYPETDTEEVILRIISKLQQTATDEAQLRRVIQQLLILSRLRNLEDITTEKTEQMPITYDITKDGIYKRGVREGHQQGMLEGKREAREETKDQVILRALKLGALTIEQIAEITEVSVDYVLKLKQHLDGDE
ncbi:MAG: hypothetical protein AAFO69_11530 [Bacteroidota bacterium]